jgi:uncharacterized protein YjeT (DUF2065 family)
MLEVIRVVLRHRYLLEDSRASSDYSNVSPWQIRRTGLLLIGLGVALSLIAFLWLAANETFPLWWLAPGTLAFWWGVVLVPSEPLQRVGIILMIIGTVWIVGFTVALSR